MPKETFFNLSEEKREKILIAAKEEFTQNELYKSRVSNIILNAEIPRGSFYQYFVDLEDLYYYVIDEMFNSVFLKGRNFIEETKDLFEFSIISFEYDYQEYKNDKRHRLMMNVLKSISDNDVYVQRYNDKRRNYILSILDKMDLSNIRLTDKDDLVKMYQTIQNFKRIVIKKSLMHKWDKEKTINEFKWYMDILKNGLL